MQPSTDAISTPSSGSYSRDDRYAASSFSKTAGDAVDSDGTGVAES